ncbi:MAG: glutaminyl-peptide cyclotransferase [Cytophagales bacterium]|nr:glutaminyl-peptide cyclotransferase [Cytophagales bacterium]
MKHAFLLLLLALLSSCSPQSNKKETSVPNANTNRTTKNNFRVKQPKHNSVLLVNDSLTVKITPKSKSAAIDSVALYVNNRILGIYPSNEIKTPLKTQKLGENILRIKAFFSDGSSRSRSRKLKVFSDISPKKLKYRIVSKYPHPTKRFTQGLVYEEPYLYEGTGQRGESSLYKTDFKSGKVLNEVALPNNRFGEGIAVFGNKIVELTWESQEGYVYDKENLDYQSTFRYPFSEKGWGITFDGKDLIMSNGSASLLYMDTSSFENIRSVIVADQTELLDSLNELEYIKGAVFSNIWMRNTIAKIDPETGKVLAYLDLSDLASTEPEYDPYKRGYEYENVLNGIAYIPEKNHLLITGKRWSAIYEIEIWE